MSGLREGEWDDAASLASGVSAGDVLDASFGCLAGSHQDPLSNARWSTFPLCVLRSHAAPPYYVEASCMHANITMSNGACGSHLRVMMWHALVWWQKLGYHAASEHMPLADQSRWVL